MSIPKLFQFSDGTTVDLQDVYAVSRPYQPVAGDDLYVRIFWRHLPGSPSEFFLSSDRQTAYEKHRQLIDRWAQDK